MAALVSTYRTLSNKILLFKIVIKHRDIMLNSAASLYI